MHVQKLKANQLSTVSMQTKQCLQSENAVLVSKSDKSGSQSLF